jgi:hypothetical protein
MVTAAGGSSSSRFPAGRCRPYQPSGVRPEEEEKEEEEREDGI